MISNEEIMEMLETLKRKVDRKTSRNTLKVKDYEDVPEKERENKTVHWHWSRGYYTGVKSTLENLSDDIEDVICQIKSRKGSDKIK